MSLILDADGAIVGRLASRAAKALLAGEEISVINAEKAIITGNPKFIKERYIEKLHVGSPQHGPYLPRRSDLIVRRVIRGMLPYKKAHGLAAFKRLRVYQGSPSGLEGTVESMRREVHSRFMVIGELSRILNG